MKKQITIYTNDIPKDVEYETTDDYYYEKNGKLKEQIDGIKIDGKYIQTSGWLIYDTDKGHCGLCGSLKCARAGQYCQGGQ